MPIRCTSPVGPVPVHCGPRTSHLSSLIGGSSWASSPTRCHHGDYTPARQLCIAKGEGRSANRFRWTQAPGADLPQAEPVPVIVNDMHKVRFQSIDGQLRLVGKPGIYSCSEQVSQALADLQPNFAQIDRLVGANLRRVQAAMRQQRLGPHHFAGQSMRVRSSFRCAANAKVCPLH